MDRMLRGRTVVAAAVTAMNQAVDLDEATRASAMSVVIDALNLAVSRFRKEARQNSVAVGGLARARQAAHVGGSTGHR
jgi:hypothetical protein